MCASYFVCSSALVCVLYAPGKKVSLSYFKILTLLLHAAVDQMKGDEIVEWLTKCQHKSVFVKV